MLDEQAREIAYKTIKYCFPPLTEESDLFDKLFHEVAVSHKVLDLEDNK